MDSRARSLLLAVSHSVIRGWSMETYSREDRGWVRAERGPVCTVRAWNGYGCITATWTTRDSMHMCVCVQYIVQELVWWCVRYTGSCEHLCKSVSSLAHMFKFMCFLVFFSKCAHTDVCVCVLVFKCVRWCARLCVCGLEIIWSFITAWAAEAKDHPSSPLSQPRLTLKVFVWLNVPLCRI